MQVLPPHFSYPTLRFGMNLAAHNMPLLLLPRMLLLLLLLLEVASMGEPHPGSMAGEPCVTPSAYTSKSTASRCS